MTPWAIRLGGEAERDFARILKDTKATFGPQQAEIYKQTLLDALAALSEGPNLLGSVARNDIGADLRVLHVARRGRRGRHFLIYRSGPDTIIDIIRILHDAMDLARHIPAQFE